MEFLNYHKTYKYNGKNSISYENIILYLQYFFNIFE